MMSVNGEAIYGTTGHKETCQWTSGEEPKFSGGTYKVAYDVNKLLQTPDEGIARKEALFTRKGAALYAICPVFPKDELVLRGIVAKPGCRVSMLGVEEPLN